MDQVSPNGTARDDVRARRSRMRAEARAQRPAGSEADRFRTPEWLERSFVLPLTEPGLSDVPPDVHPDAPKDVPPNVPSQSMPQHDDFSEVPLFVRPASREVDFARVIRRSDLIRRATRMALTSTGVTGLALIAYLLTSSPAVLSLTLLCAVVALAAAGVRVRMTAAPVPHLER
jgi:hypothetical protein